METTNSRFKIQTEKQICFKRRFKNRQGVVQSDVQTQIIPQFRGSDWNCSIVCMTPHFSHVSMKPDKCSQSVRLQACLEAQQPGWLFILCFKLKQRWWFLNLSILGTHFTALHFLWVALMSWSVYLFGCLLYSTTVSEFCFTFCIWWISVQFSFLSRFRLNVCVLVLRLLLVILFFFLLYILYNFFALFIQPQSLCALTCSSQWSHRCFHFPPNAALFTQSLSHCPQVWLCCSVDHSVFFVLTVLVLLVLLPH